jgi:hypothetical protein
LSIKSRSKKEMTSTESVVKSSGLEIDHKTIFATFSFFSGILTIALLILLRTPTNASQQLSFFTSNQSSYDLAAILALCWAIVSIPFVVSLGALLRPSGSSLAQAATILASLGVMLLAYGIYLYVSSLLSISAVSNLAPSAAESIYQAAIWANLVFYLSDPPLMALGLAQFLFGWLAWRGGIFPNWLGAIGMFGGVAGLLTLAVYQASYLAIIQEVCFALWGVVVGALLLQSLRR